jgi:hypothetical protein
LAKVGAVRTASDLRSAEVDEEDRVCPGEVRARVERAITREPDASEEAEGSLSAAKAAEP